MVISLAVSFYKTEYHPDPTIITNSDKKKCMIKDRTINTWLKLISSWDCKPVLLCMIESAGGSLKGNGVMHPEHQKLHSEGKGEKDRHRDRKKEKYRDKEKGQHKDRHRDRSRSRGDREKDSSDKHKKHKHVSGESHYIFSSFSDKKLHAESRLIK